ncbi:MAG TPA: DinB family protein [Thermoanaerobaculia bacterium]|nr:DinB family protein [Thermoanaerobaculia bacterium]
MTEALVEAWLVNNRVNLMILRELGDEALAASLSSRGGRTVGEQLAHVLEVRRAKVEAADKALAATIPTVGREQGHDREALLAGFEKSGEAVAELIRKSAGEGGQVKGFRRGIVVLIAYLIAHDAHHRGHLFLTLKQSKVGIPASLRMEIWAWNQI